MKQSKQQLNDYNKLQVLDNCLKQLGFQTVLYSVSEEVPLPMIVTALEMDEKGELLTLSLAFTPSMDDIFEGVCFLQMSVELNLEVTAENSNELTVLFNLVNGVIPIGHFTILGNCLCYRYTYPLSDQTNVSDDSVLEVISFYTLLATNHNGLFSKLATGIISLEEAQNQFLEGLE